MHVLVTGGCGFIGANLIDYMARRGGFRVRVLDNESLGKRAHIADLDAEVIVGDICDEATLARALDGVDAVVHLAADTRVLDSIENPVLNFEVNVVGSFKLLKAMRQRGLKRIVNASTGGAIIGEADPPVHEGMVPKPLSPYGASKNAVEGYCYAFQASYGFEPVSLRFANVYGPRSFHKGSVVAAFFKNVLAGQKLVVYGDGSQTRDYVYVDDLCSGIVAGLTAKEPGVYQLGTGKPTSINELIEAMRGVVAPKTVEVDYRAFREGEVVYTYCNVSKAKGALGYDPSTPLAEGLARTWQWFLAQQRHA
jgi:UDP-glucose 4-epimerase